ncbi:MAG TPA: hypothetical protein VL360_02060, partial [Gammaproteobacteria bacterium]|nr:hypothetical protein [Gammaproteobacteria bacterium]
LSVLSYFHSKYGEYHLDVNRQNKEGDTFIHTLFKLKDFPQDALLMIFNQFVLHLPNLEITNNDGLTALEYAGKISTELLNAASLSYSSYHNFASEYAKLHEDQPESAAALLKKYKHERDAAKDTFEESPQKSTRMRM